MNIAKAYPHLKSIIKASGNNNLIPPPWVGPTLNAQAYFRIALEQADSLFGPVLPRVKAEQIARAGLVTSRLICINTLMLYADP